MSEAPVPRIYLFVASDVMGDLTGYALAEDGDLLAHYAFASVQHARRSMERDAMVYRKHYPQGYKRVWVEDILADGPWQEARRRNQELWEAGRPEREAEAARVAHARLDRARSPQPSPETLNDDWDEDCE